LVTNFCADASLFLDVGEYQRVLRKALGHIGSGHFAEAVRALDQALPLLAPADARPFAALAVLRAMAVSRWEEHKFAGLADDADERSALVHEAEQFAHAASGAAVVAKDTALQFFAAAMSLRLQLRSHAHTDVTLVARAVLEQIEDVMQSVVTSPQSVLPPQASAAATLVRLVMGACAGEVAEALSETAKSQALTDWSLDLAKALVAFSPWDQGMPYRLLLAHASDRGVWLGEQRWSRVQTTRHCGAPSSLRSWPLRGRAPPPPNRAS
jgi:hypothetical protein